MGTGSWTKDAFVNYTCATKGVGLDDFAISTLSAQEVYKADRLQKELNPYGIMRECCENEEHPRTLLVRSALGVQQKIDSLWA